MIGNITTIDAAIIVAYLLFAVAFGIWIGRGQKTLNDYFLGGGHLPWWAVLGSIVATETSTATFLSVPAISYAVGGNLWFLQLAIGYIFGRLLIVRLFLPAYFRGEILTAYELLDQRFGSATKKLASILFLVARNLGDGLRLFLTAIALNAILDQSITVSIIIVGVLTIIYTFAGGMRSVIWNDCIQFVVYTVGGIAAFLLLIDKIPGGWDGYFDFGHVHNKFQIFDFSWDLSSPATFWAGCIGGMFLTLGTHGTDQMMVQRYLCARSEKQAAMALVGSSLAVFLQFALFLLLGVALACFYQHPPQSPFGDKGDRVFADFIVNQMPVGLVGLCLAAVFAAAMSTLSSSLNSSAASALNDLMMPLLRARGVDERGLVRTSRGLTIAFGILQILIAIGAQNVDQTVVSSALSIAGFVFGILLGVFVLGLLPTQIQEMPVIVGMVAGLGVVFAIWYTSFAAWPWFAVAGSVTTVIIALSMHLLLSRLSPSASEAAPKVEESPDHD